MPRIVLVVLAAALAACATHAPRTDPAPRVDMEVERHYRPQPVVVGGLDQGERTLQTRYAEALSAAAERHRRPGDREGFIAAREALYTAWADLSAHYRARLLEDLETRRLTAFRIRLQEFVPFARRHVEEIIGDEIARTGSADFLNQSDCPSLDGDDPHGGALEIMRERLDAYRTSSLLEDPESERLLLVDQRFANLCEVLECALVGVSESGTPTLDTDFAGAFSWSATKPHAKRRRGERLAPCT
jgi:hypothetical protein